MPFVHIALSCVGNNSLNCISISGRRIIRTSTDIICHDSKDIVRLELMWRSKTGRAEIANYTLTKLYNYGRAIDFLS
jgi:hypothetical protein